MTELLAGRRILIVGAGTQGSDDPDAPLGNGQAIANTLAAHGSAIACVDRDQMALERTMATVTGPNAVAVVADVRRPDDCRRLDGLVLNVGIAVGGGLATAPEAWELVFQVNVRGHALVCEAALPIMDDRASIVFIGSLAADRPGTGAPAYDASKAAVGALARYVAKEGSSRQIRANVVAPGIIDTPLGRRARPRRHRSGGRRSRRVSPFRRRQLHHRPDHPSRRRTRNAVNPGDARRTLTLRDGRNLVWSETGNRAGPAVIALHGTPGSRHSFTVDEPSWATLGARLICPDRPGYGSSTARPDMTLVQYPDMIDQLVDHLELDRFATLGYSGGGPYAAACAALLPARINRLILVSAIGPPDDRPERRAPRTRNQRLLTHFQRHPRLARTATTASGAAMNRWPERALAAMTKSMPRIDQTIASRPAVHAALLRDLADSPINIGRPLAQDMARLAQPWSFSPSDITIPTDLWHGTADLNAPVTDARRLHHAMTGSILHELNGAGHLLIYDHITAILKS